MKILLQSFLIVGLVTASVSTPIRKAVACHHSNHFIHDLSVDLDGNDGPTKTLQRYYRYLGKGDFLKILNLVDRNVEWKVEGVEGLVPFAGTYNHRIGVLKYLFDLAWSVRINELAMRYDVTQGNIIHVHLSESGLVRKTHKHFSMEIVHTWFFDEHNRIVKFREFNNTFAMASAFDPSMDPQYALVANPADDGIMPSSYPDAVTVGLTLYQALNDVDLNTFLAQLSNDVIWILAGPSDITPIAGTFLGIPGVMDFLQRLFGTETYVDFGFNYLITEGSRVDSQFYEVIYVYATGKTFTCEGIHTINVNEEGKINSFRSVNDTYSVAAGHTP
ncbi:MAG: nuclear transport factor 2 family protein [Deltaproteobacteria bacterium]|nr:nuclear transport factor 2 family protein [Deltaproteobacteria bacterium]